MKFDSLEFLAFITASLLFFYFFRKTSAVFIILALINGVFLSSFTPSILEILPSLSFVLLGYIFVGKLRQRKSNRMLGVYIAVIIAFFVYLKKYALIQCIPSIALTYTVIGLSYILFRVLHLMIDVHDRNIKGKISLLDYFNYVCFFLSLASGPIQRYQDFHDQQNRIASRVLSSEEIFEALARVVNGYIKIIFLAPFFYNNPYPQYLDYDFVFAKLHHHGPLALSGWYAFAVFSFTFKLFMNFSGYMDIVIGLGRLFHFDLPENFRHPFGTKNFLDFWTRWHITLAEWFKTYVFNPFSKVMMHRFSSPKAVPYVGVAAYFITFFIMGIWHGTTWIFVIYGLFLGLGVSGNKLYQIAMRNILGKKKYEQLSKNSIYGYLCGGLAVSYFGVALTCLWMSMDQFLSLFGHWGLIVLFVGILILGVFFALIRAVGDMLRGLFSTPLNNIYNMFEFPLVRQFGLALKLFFLIYLFLSNINPAPPFVYQAF